MVFVTGVSLFRLNVSLVIKHPFFEGMKDFVVIAVDFGKWGEAIAIGADVTQRIDPAVVPSRSAKCRVRSMDKARCPFSLPDARSLLQLRAPMAKVLGLGATAGLEPGTHACKLTTTPHSAVHV